MYLVPLFKCNDIAFTLHLRGGVKGSIVISPSLGFGVILLYSIYIAQRASSSIYRPVHSLPSSSIRDRWYFPVRMISNNGISITTARYTFSQVKNKNIALVILFHITMHIYVITLHYVLVYS